jgi:hypothetical protein
VAIIIEQDKDGCHPYAFYYTSGSQTGKDPVEMYKDNLQATGNRRVFHVYDPGRLPYGIVSGGDIIINTTENSMLNQPLKAIKPSLRERKAKVYERTG